MQEGGNYVTTFSPQGARSSKILAYGGKLLISSKNTVQGNEVTVGIVNKQSDGLYVVDLYRVVSRM